MSSGEGPSQLSLIRTLIPSPCTTLKEVVAVIIVIAE